MYHICVHLTTVFEEILKILTKGGYVRCNAGRHQSGSAAIFSGYYKLSSLAIPSSVMKHLFVTILISCIGLMHSVTQHFSLVTTQRTLQQVKYMLSKLEMNVVIMERQCPLKSKTNT